MKKHPNLGTTGNHLIFDFDLWCYDIAFAAQPKEGELLPFSYCVAICDNRFQSIMTRLDGKSFSGYLTGKGNFRHDVAKTKVYKAGRFTRPVYYQQMRDYLTYAYNAVIVDGMEADDACAIEANADRNKIIVSRDKDLLQVPARVYKYPCGKSEEMFLPDAHPNECAYFFFKQVITGDSTDNYPGLPGRGEVAAHKMLGGCETVREMFEATVFAYSSVYDEDWKQMYLEQATLAWMVRELDENNNPIIPTLEVEFYERYYS